MANTRDYDTSYGGSIKARDIYIKQITDIQRQLAKDNVYRGSIYNPATGEAEKVEMSARQARKLLHRLQYEKDELEGYAFSERIQKNAFMEIVAGVIRGLKYIFNPVYRAERKAMSGQPDLAMFKELSSAADIAEKEPEPVKEETKEAPKEQPKEAPDKTTTQEIPPNPFTAEKEAPEKTKQQIREERDAADKQQYDEIISSGGTPLDAIRQNCYLVRFAGENIDAETAKAAVEGFSKISKGDSAISATIMAASKNPEILRFYDAIDPGNANHIAGRTATLVELRPDFAKYLNLTDKAINFIRQDIKQNPEKGEKLEKALADANRDPSLNALAEKLGYEQEVPVQEDVTEEKDAPVPDLPSVDPKSLPNPFEPSYTWAITPELERAAQEANAELSDTFQGLSDEEISEAVKGYVVVTQPELLDKLPEEAITARVVAYALANRAINPGKYNYVDMSAVASNAVDICAGSGAFDKENDGVTIPDYESISIVLQENVTGRSVVADTLRESISEICENALSLDITPADHSIPEELPPQVQYDDFVRDETQEQTNDSDFEH